MGKILKVFSLFLILFLLVFGFYLYKLHSLAVEGNKIFEQRCLVVNPLLIGYKNSFLKIADSVKNPDKYSKEETIGFFDDYITGMRKYVPEENRWLEAQKKHINRWDFRLIEPWYIKQAGEYQWKMYEAYRDDAQYMLDIFDQKITGEESYSEQRQRRNKYSQLYFDFFNEATKINDWKKFFGRVPIPEACNDENLFIPETSGSFDFGGESLPPPSLPVDLEKGPAS